MGHLLEAKFDGAGCGGLRSLVTVFLFDLFSKFLPSEQGREPGKSREGCGKMLESEKELRLLVEHIAVCVENVHSSYNFG